MQLVLLPGMDGTGKLFEPVLPFLGDYPTQIILLPERKFPDYQSLSEALFSQLPKEDYILLAESFSGKLAETIAKEQSSNLKAIIFVASFLRNPSTLLLRLAKALPLEKLFGLPISSRVINYFCMDQKATEQSKIQVNEVVNNLKPEIIANRLRMMASIEMTQANTSTNLQRPVLHIFPQQDKLVSKKSALSISKSFPDTRIQRIGGPHFILQSRPEECARLINSFIKSLKI